MGRSKKDRAVKKLLLQSEEGRKNIILRESLDKLYEKFTCMAHVIWC